MESKQAAQSQTKPQNDRPRKPYTAPELTEHGTLRDLTHGRIGSSGDAILNGS